MCITRAGASTLSELVFLNIPFLAIPLLNSKDDHQFENASYYKKKGCNFFLSNNVKLAIKLKLDGVYLPSFNKSFKPLNLKRSKFFVINFIKIYCQ